MDTIPPLNRGLIQIAGFHDLDEARMAIDSGVDVLGIPLGLTVNEEDCDIATARRIGDVYPGKTCLITYRNTAASVYELAKQIAASWIQLHGDISLNEISTLRQKCSRIRVIKSLIIGRSKPEDIENQARQFAPFVDAFITDTFNPQTGAEGATGLVHDWNVSKALIELNLTPIILAGGLNPQNVAHAIHQTQPFGVDSHTGVEGQDGRKDPQILAAFISEAKNAFRVV